MTARRACVAAALCASLASAQPPPRSGDRNWRDAPMVGPVAPQYVDSAAGVAWAVSRWDGELTVPALVPGDLISDLSAAGVLADPIYELTFLDGVWDDGAWTYEARFALGPGPGPGIGLNKYLKKIKI
jgi:hypothetical protein